MKLLETFKHYELADSAPDYPSHKPIYKGYHHSYILWLPRYMLIFNYQPSAHK